MKNFLHFQSFFLIINCWGIIRRCSSSGRPMWKCDGCNEQQSTKVYTLILRAIRHNDRLSFLALDMSWQDRLAKANSKLTVSLKKFTDISKGTDSSVASKVKSNVNSTTVKFENTFFASAFYYDGRPSGNSSAKSKVSKSAQSKQYHSAIDKYLAHNPCWIPLYEPSAQSFLSGREFVVFARLPDRFFHATCKLYTSIVARQFPPVCNYDPSHLVTYELTNIGYSNVIGQFFRSLASTMHLNTTSNIIKVFTAPTAGSFLSRANNTVGSDRNINPKLWTWADPKLCPHHTFNNDPWACNFIAFTNCSNRELSVDSTQMPRSMGWKGLDKIFAADNNTVNGTIPVAALRNRYNESFELSNGLWFQSRMYAFLQRPNAQLRREIKKSLRAVRELPQATEVDRRMRMLSASNSSSQFELPVRASSAADTYSAGGVVQLSCLALHVRHGDAVFDMRSSNTKFSRSLGAHVAHARNLSLQLGLGSIFLATDNLTVVQVATTEHQEYRWYNQQRPMANSSVMYMQFTEAVEEVDHVGKNSSRVGIRGVSGVVRTQEDPLDRDDDQRLVTSKGGGRTGGKGGNSLVSEPQGSAYHSVQKDLSHVFADLRFASQCSAMVGTFDSGFAGHMRTTMCAIRNKCPVCIDLGGCKLPFRYENL